MRYFKCLLKWYVAGQIELYKAWIENKGQSIFCMDIGVMFV